MFPPDRAKIWPTVPSQILPQSLIPADLSVGDIRWQIATEWLDILQWS